MNDKNNNNSNSNSNSNNDADSPEEPGGRPWIGCPRRVLAAAIR